MGEGIAGPEELVRELWREHGKALRLAMDLRPRLADISDEYMAQLEARFPDASFELWGRGRALKEVKMNLGAWDEAGFPFTFMLRAWGGPRPQVRALVWKDSYDEHADTLIDWARGVNASRARDDEPLLDEGFTPLKRWTEWHRIFAEEDYPVSAEIAEDAFDEGTVREAVGAVVALVELLRSHVEPHFGASSTSGGEGASADG